MNHWRSFRWNSRGNFSIPRRNFWRIEGQIGGKKNIVKKYFVGILAETFRGILGEVSVVISGGVIFRFHVDANKCVSLKPQVEFLHKVARNFISVTFWNFFINTSWYAFLYFSLDSFRAFHDIFLGIPSCNPSDLSAFFKESTNSFRDSSLRNFQDSWTSTDFLKSLREPTDFFSWGFHNIAPVFRGIFFFWSISCVLPKESFVGFLPDLLWDLHRSLAQDISQILSRILSSSFSRDSFLIIFRFFLRCSLLGFS